MSRTLQLAEQLIALPSLTPEDAGCQDLIAARLAPLGFVRETIESGPADFRVRNLWAKRPSAQTGKAQEAPKLIAFAGHTDVVPTGPVAQWTSDPFTPTHRGDRLYGNPALADRLMLHSTTLGFHHPDTDEWLSFCSPPPF